MAKNKVFHSDPHKDKIVCIHTYKLLITLKKLGLKFRCPLEKVVQLKLEGDAVTSVTSEVYRRKQ